MRIARGLSLAAAVWLTACSAGPQRPDLLLVSVDTLRADALACYGGPADVGTALCGLADAGARYAWAFSTAPTTSPAVASLLTSRWTPDHGVTQNLASYLADEHVTLAEVLRDAGYATAAVVSNPMLHGSRRLQQGFDHYDARMTRRERNRPGFAERDARATTDAALAWLEGETRRPWLLWVHYQDPHGPYEPPGSPARRDVPGEPRLRVLDDDTGRGGIPKYQALPGLRTRTAYERRYRDEIRYLDRQIARLLAAVDAGGRRPAVLLTADHGEAFGEDGFYFAHGQSAGLEQIRVPLLWRPPGGATASGIPSEPVSLVDVAPTLLRAADVPAPPAFAGRPLQDAPRERALFAESERRAAVVRGQHFYARDRDPDAAANAEGRDWGPGHPSLPARGARLDDDGSLPTYDADAALEPTLARYLVEHPHRPGHRHTQVPDALREQLEALGYTDPGASRATPD